MERLQLVDLRGQDEIAFGQAVDLVRPDGYLGVSPTETDVRMVPLRFGKFAYLIDELLCFAEVENFVELLQVVFVHNFPAVQFS